MDVAPPEQPIPHEGPTVATVRELEICYETIGDPAGPALLLVMGLGCQLVHWPDQLCRGLAAQGFHVVRFDNRDAGRSTHMPGHRYTLEDMADDAAGLLDALGIGAAHVVGASMGGMIAQLMAIHHPERVLSLASVMSATGRRGVGGTSLRVYRHLFGQRARTQEQAVERRVRVFATVGSRSLDQDVAELRRVTALAYARDPESGDGRRRQHRAVRAAGDRTAALRSLAVPTVVIHGTEDRMCHPSGGRATAAAIPGARLRLVEGMGHDLPPDAWPQLVTAIVDNARRSSLGDDGAGSC